MWNLHRSPTHGYIFSPTGDAITFCAPVVVCFLALPFLYALVPEDIIPLWAYVLIVALTDVGHVWTTLFRCYLDSEENTRRSLLYNATPVAMFVLSFSVHYFVSESFFWTLLGYLAIFHFVRQQYGFSMLAKRRGRDLHNLKRDSVILYAGAVIPIVLWHLDHTRKFDWFNRDDQFLHSAVGTVGRQVLDTVLSSSSALFSAAGNSSSSAAGQSPSFSYVPLGRWASRLWMQQQEEENHHSGAQQQQYPTQQQQQRQSKNKFCSHHDCFGNERIPSGNANWGDFSDVTIGFYLAAFVLVLVVVAQEQLEQNNRRGNRNGRSHFPFFSTKHMIWVGTWITWGFGVLCPHRVVSLSFLNLFHAAPTFLVTFCCVFNRWLLWSRHAAEEARFVASEVAGDCDAGEKKKRQQKSDDVPLSSSSLSCSPSSCTLLDRFALWMVLGSLDGGNSTPFLLKAKRHQPQQSASCRFSDLEKNQNRSSDKKLLCFCIFLLFLFALGIIEEYCWETLIWHDFTDQLWEFDPFQDFSPPVYSALTALLILPQATHYFLDAFLWKHSADENPGLAIALGMETARDVPSEWLPQ